MIKDLLVDFLNRRKAAGKNNLPVKDRPDEFTRFASDGSLWKEILDFVCSDAITEGQLEELIMAMGEKENTSIAREVKEKMEQECDYSSEIRKLHPQITANELAICCFVIQGKSCKEIAGIMKVGTSTITAYRTRIRKKMKVKEGRSLKVYLDSITRLRKSRKVMQRLNR